MACGEYNITKEGEDIIARVDCEDCTYFPTIEDEPRAMARAIEILAESGTVTKIVFVQRRDVEYDYDQVQMLRELAEVYKNLTRYRLVETDPRCARITGEKYARLQDLVLRKFKLDPIGTYVQIKRMKRDEKTENRCIQKYLSMLDQITTKLENTQAIQKVQDKLTGYKTGDRQIYREIFQPSLKPDFMYTKLVSTYPIKGRELESYMVGNTEVTIFEQPDSVQYTYHIIPPEFRLTEDRYELLDAARNILSEHKPTREEFTDPQRMRAVFTSVGKDLLDELSANRGIRLRQKERDELARILVRYTVGFGLIEVLLQDEKIQDIVVNSPMGRMPMFIVHAIYGDCMTNIIPTVPEGESWASKLRMISGRPLDEANPVLDTELQLPEARARVAAITEPLNPTGIAYAFRRHRDKPWTLPLFIKNSMIDPLAAGLISFIIDGSRTMLVAGTRSAGKTSFLGSMMVDISRRSRIVTVEDTLELPVSSLRDLDYNIQSMKVASALTRGTTEVSADEGIRTTLRLGDSALMVGEVRSSLRGDQEVTIIEDGLTKRAPIKSLEDKDITSFTLPTLDEKQKIKLKKLSGFVKHPKRTQLIKITTKTGREITVTPDHSVFTHVNFKIAAIKTDRLKTGDPIIIPSKLPNAYNDIDYLNVSDIFKDKYRLEGAEPYIREAIKKVGWKRASQICGISDIYRYLLSTQKTRIPINSFLKLMHKSKIKYENRDLKIKRGTSSSIPAEFPINENIMRLLGYYLAEGNIDGQKIQITNSKQKIIKDVENICQKELKLKTYKRKTKGIGTSTQMFITCKPLTSLLEYWECGKTSKQKRIPGFVYGLSKKKICALLKGMFSGDGSISITERAGTMIRYFSTSKKLVEDVAYALLALGIVCRIHQRQRKGNKTIYLAEIKQRKYVKQFLKDIGFTHKKPEIITKLFPHSKDDSVTFDPKELEKHLKLPRKYRHLRTTKCCSKDYLRRITDEVKCSEEIYNFAHGDFFIDRVKAVETINLKKPEYVYDLSVNSTQRFIGGFGGILLHNTEAVALYEAMRVGAMANVVAGTIHGDSPYGVFDRVVNDLGVPRTSFKATDIIIVANQIRSPDGIHRWRRVTQITEVRKHWEKDPLRENGFVDLMKYDPETDKLEPTDALLRGDSEVIKAIAGNVKEWAGDWDAVWDNIQLREKIKKRLAELENKQLLEAEFYVEANDEFHKISEQVKKETGTLDSKRIYFDWNEWLKKNIKNG